MTPVVRRASNTDLHALTVADGWAFGQHLTEGDLDHVRRELDLSRFLLACDPDDGRVLGVTGSIPLQLTMPGGAALDAPGVTWVSVAPTHRRRGILRGLLARQHQEFIDQGHPVALLTASEGGIYGRFGYRPATARRTVTIDRRFARFRSGTSDPGGVRLVDAATAAAAAPALHERWRAVTPGAVSRSATWWDRIVEDRVEHRDGGTARFHLLHPDGWAAYRIHDRTTLSVEELVTATDTARVALWRVLLGMDLVETVTTQCCPLDDPLPLLLEDGRQVRTTALRDGMWARVLDVAGALAARRWAVEVDLVLDVVDPFLDRGGRFRLRGGPDGAACTPSTATPDVHADIAALGAALLGGTSVTALARSGLLTADDPAVLRRFGIAASTERLPQHGTEF